MIGCTLIRLAGALFVAALWCGGVAATELQCTPLVQAAVDRDAGKRNGHGLLWRVSAPGGAASVIFGTMHIGDPRVTNIAADVRREFDASRHFLLEVVIEDGAMQELQQAMFFTDDQSLVEVAGDDLFNAAAARLQAYGIPPALAQSMKPWAVFTTLSLPAGTLAAPLDLQLMMQARAAGKEVQGLETMTEQIAVFESLSPEHQVQMLRKAVCHYDFFQREVEHLIELYVARNLTELTRLSLRFADAAEIEFLDTLLWQRNRRMAERLLPTLADGAAFVAIGALHLPGEAGVLALLQKRGYAVEAIY